MINLPYFPNNPCPPAHWAEYLNFCPTVRELYLGRLWSSRLECELPRQCPRMVENPRVKNEKSSLACMMNMFLRHAAGQHQWNAEAEKSSLLFFQERQLIDQLCLSWPSDLSTHLTDYYLTNKYQLIWERACPLLEITTGCTNEPEDWHSFQSLAKGKS